jgi:heme-degrading monooxygenase HmoA
MAAGYTYVWEFLVPPESQAEFERHYGTGGTWVQLFRQAPGHIETLLLKDQDNPGRYLTIDRWQSELAYRSFRSQFAQQYDALDCRCEGLTLREAALGTFSE